MKKVFIGLIIIAILGALAYAVYSVKNSSAYTAVDRQLSAEKTVDSKLWRVKSAGISFFQYSWKDPFGRVCTQTTSNKTGMTSLDCDFEPKDLKVKF